MPSETLWTGFQNRKIAAERAVKDAKGRNIADNIDLISKKLYFAGDKTASEIETDATLQVPYAVYRVTTSGVIRRTDDVVHVSADEGWDFDGALVPNDMIFWYNNGTTGNWMLCYRTTIKVKVDSTNGWDSLAVNTTTGKMEFLRPGSGIYFVETLYGLTQAEKTKLGGIAAGAEVNVQSDWNETDSTSDAYIANKPTIPAAQVQSDWAETDTTDVSYIANKPTQLTMSGDGTYITVTEGTGTLTVALTVHTGSYTVNT